MIYDLDPETRMTVFSTAFRDFDGIVEDVLKNNPEEFYENLPWIEVAKMFYLNGYIHGAGEYMENPEFAEAIKLFTDEIAYQKKYNNND